MANKTIKKQTLPFVVSYFRMIERERERRHQVKTRNEAIIESNQVFTCLAFQSINQSQSKEKNSSITVLPCIELVEVGVENTAIA